MEQLLDSEQTSHQATPTVAQLAAELQTLARSDGLRTWRLAGRELIPVVQGGMGVGVSAGSLAGTVASFGGVGTVSSVDLRRMHPDLMAQTGHLDKEPDAKAQIDAANLVALDREIQRARGIAQGRGLIAVNVMKALSAYEQYVRQALESGADAVVVGAGLPLDLPELARDHPDTALIPILSDARGVQLLVRKWERKQRRPDAIVIEHPRLAGGHLGAAKIADLGDPRFDFENVSNIMVVVEAEGQRVALLVDELLGQQQVVIKNLESNYRKVPNVSGATILGDGKVALILDTSGLVRRSRH